MAELSDPQSQQPRRLDLSRFFAAISVAIGLVVLVGWLMEIDSLTRVFPGLITMKPNAALGFLLGGLALWLIRDGREVSRWAIGLSAMVASIGGLTLIEYVLGVDFGIDQILHLEPPGQVGTLVRGRMHPTTAFDFLVLGLALGLIAADREHRAAHGMAVLAALVAGSTLISYLYGVRTFVGMAVFHQMALHTTLGMLAMAAGLLTARPRSGLMVPISDPGSSGQLARWLMPVAILTPIIATGLTILAREAGLFDERFGSAVRVTVVITVFVACIWRASFTLHRLDKARLQADLDRREGDRRFRVLTEALPQIAWTTFPNGEVDYTNRRWFDYTGHEHGHVWDWHPVIHPVDLEPFQRLWMNSTRSGQGFQAEFRFRRHDGAYRWHLVRAEPMRDESGRITQWVGTSTDINDQKRVGQQRYRSLVEATAAIVWSTPPSGHFEAEQPSWSAFTGQSFEELKGAGWLEAVHPDDRERTARDVAQAIDRRTAYQVSHRLRRYDGEYRHMLARAVPLLEEDGMVREWFGVHSDVDDQEKVNQAMRAAKEAAEAAARSKGEFLANMSHEIRTPMNGVLGMTELALATELTPRQREYLGIVKSSADSLLTVIDDILDFSKIEAGKLTLEPIPFSPRDVVTDALRSLAFRAHKKGLELACRIAPEVPSIVLGDPGRLRQVLLNLAGNALKFTEHGEVVVTVEPDPSVDGSPGLRFSVADTGIGIPAEKRDSIFAPFEQADGSTTRKYGGTGLGLTISSRLIDLMGGRIWVEENPSGGSIFRFTAQLDRDPEVTSGRPSETPIILDGLRVLIVDDNQTNRMILEEVLWQWGCRPVAAASGQEAMRVMRRSVDRGEPFSMILLDLMMPEMDGCELAARLRSEFQPDVPKLMMLTSGGLDDQSRSAGLGIDAWLAKPIRQSELLNAMLDLIGTTIVPAEAVVPEPTPTIEPTAPTSSRPLRVLVAEDHPINQRVVTRMLQGQGHEVTVVGNGRLAVEAVKMGEFDVVLMDVQMPELDGFEALEAIRARERDEGGHLPIIAVTAHAMTGDRDRCLVAGFDDYLSKPIRIASLADSLKRIVGQPSSEPNRPVSPSTARADFDLDAALHGLDGDEDLLREILALFLDDFDRIMAEFQDAIDCGDFGKLKLLGHTLAGSAGHFAATKVSAVGRRLEAIGQAGNLDGADHALEDLGREFDRFRRAVGESRVAIETP